MLFGTPPSVLGSVLDMPRPQVHINSMSEAAPPPLSELDDAEADARALKAAIAESRADPRGVPHEEMRVWLLKIAAGEFDAKPPTPRHL